MKTAYRLRVAALCAALMLALAACGGGNGASQSSATNPDRPGGEGKIVVAAGGGGVGESAEKLLREWAASVNVDVTYTAQTSDESYAKVLAQKDNQSFDIVWTNAWTEGRGIQAGLFAPLDPKIVTNLQEIYPLAHVKDNLGVRFGFSEVGILYNAKIYKERGLTPPTSWDDVWAPGVKGHVLLGDVGGSYCRTYMAYLAKTLTGDEANVEAAVDYIVERKPWILAIGATIAQREQIMLSGEAWITVDGSASAIPLAAANPDLKYARPQEGTPAYQSAWVMLKGAKHPVATQQFINYAIGVKAQEWFVPEVGMAPVNPLAKMDPEYAKGIPYGPDGIKKLVNFDPIKLVESQDRLKTLWKEKVVG